MSKKQSPITIGLIGEFNPASPTHAATSPSLEQAAAKIGATVYPKWISTTEIEDLTPSKIEDFHGFLFCTGVYKNPISTPPLLNYLRTNRIPTLGTCAGFQHLMIEIAQGILGINDAAHQEFNPEISDPFIAKMSCSLAGTDGVVTIRENTLASTLYKETSSIESYYCSFGINPKYRAAIAKSQLRVSGVDENEQIRIVEIPEHPFYMGTLFVPQVRSSMIEPHPIIVGFLQASGSI